VGHERFVKDAFDQRDYFFKSNLIHLKDPNKQEVGHERFVKDAFDQRDYFTLQIYRLAGTV
jgi:hypothetical protein